MRSDLLLILVLIQIRSRKYQHYFVLQKFCQYRVQFQLYCFQHPAKRVNVGCWFQRAIQGLEVEAPKRVLIFCR